MEKLVLKDGTVINVEGGTTTNVFTVVVVGADGLRSLLDTLTEENLSHMELKNEADLVCAVWENRKLNNVSVVKIEKTENWAVTVELKEKDMVTQRLKALEEEQKVLNDAVAEMSETVYS